MPAKFTYEYVKSYIEEFDYILLSKEYVNAHTKIHIKCPEGHQFLQIFDSFHRGSRCPHCAANIKFTYEYVKKYIESVGYKLLSKEYVNNKTKIKLQCDSNHIYWVKFDDFRRGIRCARCAGLAKPTYEEVKKYIESVGYKLLSKEYVRAHAKLYMQCPNGHQYRQRFDSFKSGARCPHCSHKAKHTYAFVKEYVESFGYKLLSKKYVNSKYKLQLQCPAGHQYKQMFCSFYRGSRCPHCSHKAKHTYAFVKEYVESFGYKLLSKKYVSATTKMRIQCNEGHEYKVRFSCFKSGRRCPVCHSLNRYGENAAAWKGGISFEPYCPIWGDKEFKEYIKARDGYKCLNPDCYGTGSGAKLSIHHIDYNKKNCVPSNLITLCRSCNSRANKDRDWHEAWYKAIIYKRYRYDRSKKYNKL